MKTALLTAFLLSASVPALAQDNSSGWYAGAGVGRLETVSRPYYTYYLGGIPDQYENRADGFEFEVLAGKRQRLTERLSLSFEATASFNSLKWSLSIPEEPADLEYTMPYRFALSAVPELQFGRVSVFANLGGGLGRVHERKTTPATEVSRYDYDEMRPTLNLGGGIRVRAADGFDVFARAGYAKHFGVEYDTFSLSYGGVQGVTMVEHVVDKPRAVGVTVGIVRRF